MGKRKFIKNTFSAGSALILAVVLTSLLAIVGTIFLMAARVDKIATSAISENKELNFAVEAVVAAISHELALDVPGMQKGDDYYDYPDVNNRWLASLEPYEDGTTYKWHQISDVTGFLNVEGFSTEDVDVKPVGLSTTVYVRDYPVIRVDSDGSFLDDNGNIATDGVSADADGDGIADSKWIELKGTTSAKGKRIYAAVRVIDNGGMINVNTAHDFDTSASIEWIDGSSLMQINLSALARSSDTIDDIDDARNPAGNPLSDYEWDCIWRIEDPNIDYLPFDIADELELRNRYFLTSLAKTRLEDTWNSTIGHSGFKRVPYDGEGIYDDDHWWDAINQDANRPDKRHFLTTRSFDRIIDPDGFKMLNINDINSSDVGDVYRTIRDALDDANFADANDVAAQLAVNLVDYRDGPNEPEMTTYTVRGKTYYGFESPCIYISELAHRWIPNPSSGGPITCNTYRSYAVELYKPYREDAEPNSSNQWRLFIDNSGTGLPGNETVDIDWADGADFHVIRWHNPSVELDVDPDASSQDIDNICNKMFDAGSIISLERRIQGGGSGGSGGGGSGGGWIAVDSLEVPGALAISDGWLMARDGTALSIQRDITLHKCIRRLWSGAASDAPYTPTLGYRDDDEDKDYRDSSPEKIQAHPADEEFTNVGEIGMLFRKDVYDDSVIKGATEADVRLDLEAEPAFRQILKYFTRFDPSSDGINNDGDYEAGGGENIDEENPAETPEFKIPGRININTAPWYVMAQLPWIQYGDSTYCERARAICDYRDNADRGFDSIGELMGVNEMLSLGSDDVNNLNTDSPRGPDLTDDTSQDDFEERDLIFARISDLVTVRSDVFTAYILVRIGIDGPQKRVIAVLDRSNVYPSGGKVKVAALHPVPDPR